jgi:hypothetical protein
MAKTLTSKAEAPEAGSSPAIPNRNEEAVFLSHLNKLRIQEAKKAIAKAAYDTEANALTDLFREAKTDGFTRKELQAILDDGKASRRDLTAEEERRAQLRSWAGLPAGTQADLFASPSPAQDELHAEGQGYTAGLRGDDSTMPDNFAPHHAPAFLRGWHAGQEKLAWAMSEAGHNPEKADSGVKLAGPVLVADNDATDAKKPDAA